MAMLAQMIDHTTALGRRPAKAITAKITESSGTDTALELITRPHWWRCPKWATQARYTSVSTSSAITWAMIDAAVMRSTGLSTLANSLWPGPVVAGSPGRTAAAHSPRASSALNPAVATTVVRATAVPPALCTTSRRVKVRG